MFSDVRADKMLLFWKVLEPRTHAINNNRRLIKSLLLNVAHFTRTLAIIFQTKIQIIFVFEQGIQKGSELDILIGGLGLDGAEAVSK